MYVVLLYVVWRKIELARLRLDVSIADHGSYSTDNPTEDNALHYDDLCSAP